MVDGLCGVLSPGEGPVAVADDGRHGRRIKLAPAKLLHDHRARVELVVLVQLLLGEMPREGHGPIEVVRMRLPASRAIGMKIWPDASCIRRPWVALMLWAWQRATNAWAEL